MNKHVMLLDDNFEAFVRLAFWATNGGKELGDDPYISYLCHELAGAKDAGARLVVNMPPRHLKTFVGAICLPAWLLGRDPAEKILLVTYGADLAEKSSSAVRDILKSAWYRRRFPGTVVAKTRDRAADFATTEGGGLFAVSVEGPITGRGGSVIIFDDPLQIKDAGNREQIAKINQLFDNVISSRLNNPKEDRMVIIAHRLHRHDLSGHVLDEGGWTHIALPFIAPCNQTYNLGGRKWHRKKGEHLRPHVFSDARVATLEKSINPDFETFYQQMMGESAAICINAKMFKNFTGAPPDAPVVISVDPGHRPGPEHSYTVMQAWSPVGDEFFLLDQWREQEDVGEATRVLQAAVTSSKATAVLVELTGYGQTLARDLQRRFPSLWVECIQPNSRSKTARLLGHIKVIESRRINLPIDADWREVYEAEFEQFPHGPFDDQVDAMTQFLDFMAKGPKLKKPPPMAIGVRAISPGGFPPFGRPGYRPGRSIIVPHGDLSSRGSTRIFPRKKKD